MQKSVKVKKMILFSLGWLSAVLAVVGAILPLMPSFVFILIASFCFARSSKKYSYWLRHNRFFGETLMNYETGLGFAPATKCRAIAMIWGSIGVSIYFVQNNLLVVGLLVIIATSLTVFLIKQPSLRS